MIRPTQVEEWINEVEERPSSAPIIIRQIARRLIELVEKNEQLLSENIALCSGERVTEYESRISNLEYQLALLKRQVATVDLETQETAYSLLVYNERGRVFRLEFHPDEVTYSTIFAELPVKSPLSGDFNHLLTVDAQEELLFVFDSGRAVSLPVAAIPKTNKENIDWSQAYIQEPRGSENLAFILPIARMALYEYCTQVSRRGYVKKIRESFLESCIASANVGTGVTLPADKTYTMAFCSGEDEIVLVSKEGFLLAVPISRITYTIEECIRLSMMDYVVSAFILGKKSSILAVTQNGKVFHRDAGWIEPTASLKTQGKAILSKARRESGVRIVAAAAVDEADWCVLLTSDGKLRMFEVGEMSGSGTVIGADSKEEVLSFTVFNSYRDTRDMDVENKP